MSTETPTEAGHAAEKVRRQNRTANVASPWRITAGVVALAFGAWGVLYATVRLFTKGLGPSTPFVGWMNFLIIVGAIGCLVTGIVIIVKQRKRGGATPWLVGSFAAAILIAALGLGGMDYSGTAGGDKISMIAALVTIAFAGVVIVLEKNRR
ncbi:hypothetical protein [Paenarthrobacter sp. YJN-5]|uniref:hypothetical protein n=1 Tax=Paenarthrobacter sp. YJN-5 TaxID=2735316 RepID=UPI001877D206|nr:hypothetical protein [Paenarthrobacter sp. YJN-5]QOT19538.1 hypothetical protein HMI59_23200 [Paenarthrobacter sp. YJN-5]